MYKLTESGVLRLEDNAWIPNCADNRDWIEYQAWLVEGNTPEPMDVAESPKEVPSLESQVEELKAQIAILMARELS